MTLLKSTVLAVLMLTILPETALACEKCFGAGGEAEGITLAMLSLIAMTGLVWGGIGAFFLNIRRRTRQLEPGELAVTEQGDLVAPAAKAS